MINIVGDLTYNTIFCDWLSVTYSPDDNIYPELSKFLASNDFILDGISSSPVKVLYRPVNADNSGLIRIDIQPRFVKVSITGLALAYLRSKDIFGPCLTLLGSCPHKVTRLDLSMDVENDFPEVLHGLRTHYPNGLVSFSRKKLSAREYLSHRSDGKMSGTFYIGTSKSVIHAKIYDKQLEAFEKRKQILPICTRYEITFKGGCTLKDAYYCDPLFWKHASVLLLDYLRPDNVPPWVDGSDFIGWTFTPDQLPPYPRIQQLLETDNVLVAIERISSLIPDDGHDVLMDLITKRLDMITAARVRKINAKS